MKKRLVLYIIDGWPSLVISYRPKTDRIIIKRVYYKVTGSDVIRFFSADHTTDISTHNGSEIISVALTHIASSLIMKGGTK